jgi:hypothetical protein
MQQPDPIIIDNFAMLLRHLEKSEFWVKWEVRCEIGPDWIGGGRSIYFYLDRRPLAENLFHDRLRLKLIQVLDIPAESPDEIVSGEGEIQQVNDTLEIEFEWWKAIPYANPGERGYGRKTFIDLSTLEIG